MSPDARPIVIAGLPRSGTTWTLQALGSIAHARRLNEPDNEDKFPPAIHAKHQLGRYPVLGAGDEARPYRRLWAWILNGGFETARSRRARQLLGPGEQSRIFEGRRDVVTWLASTIARDPSPTAVPSDADRQRRMVVKSIHLQLALDWLVSEFDVDVVVLLRHPANVLASWLEVKLKDSRNSTLERHPLVRSRYVDRWGVPLPGPDPVERMCWRIGLLVAALEESLAAHPTWHVRTHEQLCTDPRAEFAQLYDELGLEWRHETEVYLRSRDRPGEGFIVSRVASEVADSWQRRLDDDQLATLRRVLAWFPITTWSERDYERTTRTDS